MYHNPYDTIFLYNLYNDIIYIHTIATIYPNSKKDLLGNTSFPSIKVPPLLSHPELHTSIIRPLHFHKHQNHDPFYKLHHPNQHVGRNTCHKMVKSIPGPKTTTEVNVLDVVVPPAGGGDGDGGTSGVEDLHFPSPEHIHTVNF